MGLFDIFSGNDEDGFRDTDEMETALEAGYLKEVPGSGGKTVFETETGREFDRRDGKPR